MIDKTMSFLDKIWREISSVFVSWNGLDYSIAVVAVGCTVLGAIRGFKPGPFSLFRNIGAFIVAVWYYSGLVPWVRKRLFFLPNSSLKSQSPTGGAIEGGGLFSLNSVHAIVAFLLLFSFVWAGLGLIRLVWKKFPDSRAVWMMKRVVGAAIGFFQFLFLWCILTMLLRACPLGVCYKWIETSLWVNKTAEWILDVIAKTVTWQK